MNIITSGESHGYGFYGIVEGFPSHFRIDIERINNRLRLRQSVFGRGERMKIEDDKVEIKTGLWNGETTGSPMTFFIPNKSLTPPNERTSIPRPGHADLGGMMKFDFDDTRVITERASARRTVMDVAIGEFARQVLESLGIKVYGFTKGIGGIETDLMANAEPEIGAHPLLCPDTRVEEQMIEIINEAYKEGYTLGGKVTVVVRGMPVGIGTFAQRQKRLTSIIGKAIFDIPSVKGVIFGDENIWKVKGYEGVDDIFEGLKRKTNHAGGIEGGMTNGQDIVINLVAKPISTQKRGVKSVDLDTMKESETTYIRSDTCVVGAIVIVATAVVATAIMNELIDSFGGFTFEDLKGNFSSYRRRINEFRR
ncbi:MAG: chorismate synthase [Athalassotoga sp.]|uniref:chorismate synthase n=1 Tax=Athalassotoga sp. TaxID=2022597 RepID=UPI003CFE22FF